MGKATSKANATGRNDKAVGSDGRVVILRRSLWHSPQISAASVTARALMFELASMHNGANNGRIYLSVRDATHRLGFSSFYPASAAFDELEALGLITNTLASSFNMKAGDGSLARAWSLNWIKDGGKVAGPESLAALDFKRLDAKTKRRLAARQAALDRYTKERTEGNFAVVDSTTLSARSVVDITTTPPDTVVEITTPPLENGGNASPPGVEERTTHIDHHSLGEAGDDPLTIMRSTIADWWRTSGKSDRIRLAQKNGLEIGELLGFVDGSHQLQFPKVVALHSSLRAAA